MRSERGEASKIVRRYRRGRRGLVVIVYMDGLQATDRTEIWGNQHDGHNRLRRSPAQAGRSVRPSSSGMTVNLTQVASGTAARFGRF